MKADREVTIAVIGNIGVGKSALVDKFATYNLGRDCHITHKGIAGEQVEIRVHDLQQKDNYFTPGYRFPFAPLRLSNGIMLCFDISDRKSFDDIQKNWHPMAKGKHIVLVGTKADSYNAKKLTRAEVETWAKDRGIAYVETSATLELNIYYAFGALVEQCLGTQKSATKSFAKQEDEEEAPKKKKGLRKLSNPFRGNKEKEHKPSSKEETQATKEVEEFRQFHLSASRDMGNTVLEDVYQAGLEKLNIFKGNNIPATTQAELLLILGDVAKDIEKNDTAHEHYQAAFNLGHDLQKNSALFGLEMINKHHSTEKELAPKSSPRRHPFPPPTAQPPLLRRPRGEAPLLEHQPFPPAPGATPSPRAGRGERPQPPRRPRRQGPEIFMSHDAADRLLENERRPRGNAHVERRLDARMLREMEEQTIEEAKTASLKDEQDRKQRAGQEKKRPQPENTAMTEQELEAFGEFIRETLPHVPELAETFICPITHLPFVDPVMGENGRTYSKAAIEAWLNRGNDTDPEDRSHVTKEGLRPNRKIQDQLGILYTSFRNKDKTKTETEKKEGTVEEIKWTDRTAPQQPQGAGLGSPSQ